MTLPHMKHPTHFRQRLAACGLSLAAGVCWAAEPKPPVMDAGALHRQTDQSVRASAAQREQAKLQPIAAPLVLANQQTVSTKAFRFLGATRVKPEVLQAAAARFANRALTQADLDNLCTAVVDAYRQNGWVVRAYVPQQDLSGDTLTLQILETLTQSSPK